VATGLPGGLTKGAQLLIERWEVEGVQLVISNRALACFILYSTVQYFCTIVLKSVAEPEP
jgi:hypothetical protein